jgi:hypothetical protein
MIDIEWENGDLLKAVIYCPHETEKPVIRLKNKIISDQNDPRIKYILN